MTILFNYLTIVFYLPITKFEPSTKYLSSYKSSKAIIVFFYFFIIKLNSISKSFVSRLIYLFVGA